MRARACYVCVKGGACMDFSMCSRVCMRFCVYVPVGGCVHVPESVQSRVSPSTNAIPLTCPVVALFAGEGDVFGDHHPLLFLRRGLSAEREHAASEASQVSHVMLQVVRIVLRHVKETRRTATLKHHLRHRNIRHLMTLTWNLGTENLLASRAPTSIPHVPHVDQKTHVATRYCARCDRV